MLSPILCCVFHLFLLMAEYLKTFDCANPWAGYFATHSLIFLVTYLEILQVQRLEVGVAFASWLVAHVYFYDNYEFD